MKWKLWILDLIISVATENGLLGEKLIKTI